MKLRILPLFLIIALLFAGCSSSAETNISTQESSAAPSSEAETEETTVDNTDVEVTEITEKLFSQQIDYIYFNPSDYIGTTISYEGMYDLVESGYSEETYEFLPCVYRFGPGGCCGNDSLVGFEINWNGEEPEANAWVRVTGEIDYTDHWGMQYLILNVTSLEVLDERGEEYVT